MPRNVFVSIIVTLAALAGLILATGQGCSKPSSQSPVVDRISSGGGYGGMISYVTMSSEICSDGSDILASISIGSGETAQLTRDNCQNITATSLQLVALQLMPYNPSNLIYANRPFDEVNSNSITTGVLCRSSSPYALPDMTAPGTPAFELADYRLYNFGVSEAQPFSGDVISGLYDSQMNFLSTQSAVTLTFQQVFPSKGLTTPVVPPANVTNLSYFQASTADGLTNVTLVFGVAPDGTLQGTVATVTTSTSSGPTTGSGPIYYNGPVTCYQQQ